MQSIESKDITNATQTYVVAVTNEFHIFKFWQESHGGKNTSLFISEKEYNKIIQFGDQSTHKKMQETGYKGSGAALQALCA